MMFTAKVDFAGGGLVCHALQRVGFTIVNAVEIDPKIASVFALNFGNEHLIVDDVSNVDPNKLGFLPGELDFYQASPSCKKFSVANPNKGETADDLASVAAIARNLMILRPKAGFIENVRGFWGKYKDGEFVETESYKLLITTLKTLGYWYDTQILNAADFGTPQSRERVIVRFIRRDVGELPIIQRTHTEHPDGQLDLFSGVSKQKWVSWFDAIAHKFPEWPYFKIAIDDNGEIVREPNGYKWLLVTPDGIEQSTTKTGLAPWQIERLSEVINSGKFDSFLIHGKGSKGVVKRPVNNKSQPSFTIVANDAATARPSAIIVSGTDSYGDYINRIRTNDRPMMTLTGSDGGRAPYKVVLIERVGTANDSISLIESDRPSKTIKALHNCSGHYHKHDALFFDSDRISSVDELLRNAKIYKIPPEGLAIFQGLDASYKLPNSASLAGAVIGNGVPVQLTDAIARPMFEILSKYYAKREAIV